jgi:phage terminase large subunit-like protein
MCWRLDWFIWFAEQLTLPVTRLDQRGPQPIRLEPFQRFILKMAFKTGRSDLLVLLPKGNGKTLLFAALAVFHLLTIENAECYIGAADRKQADTMYRFAKHFVESEPELGAVLKVTKSERKIVSRRDQGFILVIASDQSKEGGKNHSYNPSLALIDELHAHSNDNLFTALTSATFKRGGLVIVISTAGHDEETSTLGIERARMYDWETTGGKVRRELVINAKAQAVKSRDGRLTIVETPSGEGCMLEWACNSDDDLDDLEVVKLANPASFVTIGGLRNGKEKLDPATFARYRANVWAQASDAMIKSKVWDSMNDGSTIPKGEPRWVVVDYAGKSDGCAVTQMYLDEERGKVIPKAHVWARRIRVAGRPQPAAHTLVDDETIRTSIVRKHIREIHENEGEVLGVIYDPHLFDPEELEEEGFLMIEFPQRLSRQIPASKKLYDVVNEDGFAHDGDPVLRSHVISAGAKAHEDGWRFAKSKSRKLIDACICLTMGIEQVLEGAPAKPFIVRVG